MSKIFKLLNEIQKKYLFIIIVLLILLSLLELLTFSLLQPIINYFTDKNNLNISYIYKINFFKNATIFNLLGIFFVIFLLRGLLNIYISYRKHSLVRNINNTLSKRIFLNYLNQNFSFFVDNNSAKMVSNIINEVEKFSYRLVESLIGLATEIFIIVAILAFLFLNYFKGTIILGSSVIIFFSVFYYYFKSKFKRFGEDKTLYDSIKINDYEMIVIVADNVPRALFNFNEKRFMKKTLTWKIKDVSSGNDINECRRVIKQVIGKVDKLNKQLISGEIK
jgi:ABC-type multidrug transport system fused ATPase/permease subunit